MLARRVLVPAAVLGTLAGVGAVALLIRSSIRSRSGAAPAPSSASVWSAGARGIRYSGRRSHPAYRGAAYNGYNGFHAGGSDSYSSPGDGCDSGTSC